MKLNALIDQDGYAYPLSRQWMSVFVVCEDGRIYNLCRLRELGVQVKVGNLLIVLTKAKAHRYCEFLVVEVTSLYERTSRELTKKIYTIDSLDKIDMTECKALIENEGTIRWIMRSFAQIQYN